MKFLRYKNISKGKQKIFPVVPTPNRNTAEKET
jgi:hypothetical protein